MSQPIRLIAMDMDGTLLTRVDPETACIPPQNAAVLRECADRGIHLALASGRMPDDAGFFAIDAGLTMHIIGLNGGITLNRFGEDPVDEHYLPEDAAREIMSILEESGVDVAVFGSWESAALYDRPLSWAKIVLGTYFGRKGGRMRFLTGKSAASSLLSRAGKIVALTDDDRDSLAKAKEQIRCAFPELMITSSWWNNFEVNPAGVDKGSALRKLAKRLGIPMSQVMAIGDNDNDVPMLRAAGISVAVGNATDAAISAATHLTLPHDQFGVAAAIRTLVLGERISGVTRL